MRYSRVGSLDVRDVATYTDKFWLSETSYTVWSPLGGFIELYTNADKGLFFGVSGSIGHIPAPPPPPGTITTSRYMAGYAIEAGYETSRLGHGLGAFLRFSGWTGTQSFLFTDFPEGLDSRELTLSLRWTFRP